MNKQKIGLAVASLVAVIIAAKIYFTACAAPEKVTDIVSHWAIAWTKGGIIAVIIGCIIFAINMYIKSEKIMSILGIVFIGITLPCLITLFFGYHTTMVWVGIIAGIIIGYFCYIIDDGLLELWEVRHITLPVLIGLGFGGSVIVACIYENWQDENIFVTGHSTCTELTVERYTYHYRSSKRGGSYYSWDYHTSYYYFDYGHSYRNPIENIDYTLGTGAYGRKDRVSESYHDWIGCISYHKASATPKWIYLKNPNLQYQENSWYEAEENFFGQAMLDGKPIEAIESNPTRPTIKLPTSDEVPGVATLTRDFIKIMFTHPDFSLLRWIYILMYLPFFIFILFAAEYRMSFVIFLGASTIIILILIIALSARSGRRISRRSFSGFGGGSFSGGGASSNW